MLVRHISHDSQTVRNTPDTVLGQSMRSGFQNKPLCTLLLHPFQALHQLRYRHIGHVVDLLVHVVANTVGHSTHEANLVTRQVHHAVDHVSSAGFAVGAGHTDDFQPVRRKPADGVLDDRLDEMAVRLDRCK